MGIAYALGNVILAPLHYRNWPEVITAVAKRQEPAKVVLKSGLQIEAVGSLKCLVREICIDQPYTSVFPIGENDVVVDIGANSGVFTLFAASRTRNTVYAFEPAPENFTCIERNIRANGLSNVIAHKAAVSDTVGSTKLFLSSIRSGGHVLFDPNVPDKCVDAAGTDKFEDSVEVPTTTLPEIMDSNHLERIDFLKLDCEGSEGAILRTTPQAYLKRVGKIAMEFHDHLSPLDHNEMQKLLEEAGFRTRLKQNKKFPVIGYLFAWRV